MGIISFEIACQYNSKQIFQKARATYRIAVSSKFDRDGGGVGYSWHVHKVRTLATPVPVERTGQTGFGKSRFSVSLPEPAADDQDDPGPTADKRIRQQL